MPSVRAVHAPLSGVLYHAYIQMEKLNEGDAKNVLMAALTRTPYIKGAFVFDNDVDIFDEDEVLWALSTRVVPDRDIMIIPGARGESPGPDDLHHHSPPAGRHGDEDRHRCDGSRGI